MARLHVAEDASSWIVATRLPTNVFHLFDGPCIHVKTKDESVHKQDSLTGMLRARVAFLYSLDKNVAAQSFSLGIVSCFRGATFDVEHRSLQDVFFL